MTGSLISQSIYQLISGKANYFDPASAEYAAQSNLLHFLLIVMGFRWLYKRYITDVTFLSRRSYTKGSHKITEVNLYLSTNTNLVRLIINWTKFPSQWISDCALKWLCPLCWTQGQEETFWKADPEVIYRAFLWSISINRSYNSSQIRASSIPVWLSWTSWPG